MKSFLVPNINYSQHSPPLHNFLQETFALSKRLFVQSFRRPSTLVAGTIQPLLWLILFGALLQNAPISLFTQSNSYRQFLTPGVIVFTVFTSALNSGLPLIFDREFGFFNRLIVTPLISKLSIIAASSLYITVTSLAQTCLIIIAMSCFNTSVVSSSLLPIICILFLLSSALTMFSISLTFFLPGHIELLALIFIINLPTLFASTALAPFSFMPMWLQVIASLNPLSYAIETIRYLYAAPTWTFQHKVISTLWGTYSLADVGILLIVFNIVMISLSVIFIRIKMRFFT